MLKEPAAGPGSHSQADSDKGRFSLTFEASASYQTQLVAASEVDSFCI